MLFDSLFQLIRLYKRYGNGLAGFGFFLWKVFSIHFLYKEKTINWTPRLKWIVHRDFQSSKNPWYYGISEKMEFEFLLQNLNSGDVLYDIGANVGLYSFWLSSHHPIQCYLFEPDPKHQNFIQRLINLNHLESQCILQAFALGEQNAMRYLTIDKDINNKVTYQTSGLPISMRRLDDLTELPKPTILKIDTEGYESLILEGGLQTLASEKLRIIIIEKNELQFEKNHEKLKSFGFKPMISAINSKLIEEITITKSGNVIYLKK